MSTEYSSGENARPMVLRRLGTAPSDRGQCTGSTNCPDVFELSSGDFAVIGRDVSLELELPADAGRSDAERVVVVPQDVLLAALKDLSGRV